MMSIFSKAFWRASAERAIKATAWTAGASLAGSGVGIIEADWLGCASIAGMAGVLSLLGSIGSDAITEGSGPSLTDAETLSADVVAQVAPSGVGVVAGPASIETDGVPVKVEALE